MKTDKSNGQNAREGQDRIKIRLVIAESNLEEQKKLEDYFSNNDEFEVAGTASDGETALTLVESHNPSVVLCSFALKGADGITLTERIKEYNSDTKIIMFSSAFSDQCIKRMVDCGVDYYLLRPFEFESLRKQILYMNASEGGIEVVAESVAAASAQVAAEHEDVANNTERAPRTQAAKVFKEFSSRESLNKIDERVSNIFITVGIPAHIKGYKFLREAVRLTIEKPGIINSITKQLYPSIAERFETTASKVERAIRHAIEVGWNRGRIESINDIFGVKVYGSKDKPTNGEFIALVADKMMLEGVG